MNRRILLQRPVDSERDFDEDQEVFVANDQANKPNPTQIQKFLGGMDYPAGKQKLVEHAREQGAPDDIIQTLEGLPDREFEGPTGIIDELY